MLRSGQRKVFASARVSQTFRPTDNTGVGVVIPSYLRADIYNPTVLADTPTFFFRMDEASGNLVDLSGNGFSGVVAGTGTGTYRTSTGRTNVSVGIQLASASSQRFEVADNAALDITGALTYEIWFRFATIPGAEQILMTKGYSGGNGSYDIILGTSGGVKINQDGVGGLIAQGTALSTGVLHHVMLTRSGSTVTCYVDGVSYSSSGSGFTPADTTQVFCIGCSSQSGSRANFFNGILAGCAIYNTALSSACALAHYNAGI